ncbi:hypothetical protein J7J84_05185 [bacterium]|nr:hypothetical protein [bacterium]
MILTLRRLCGIGAVFAIFLLLCTACGGANGNQPDPSGLELPPTSVDANKLALTEDFSTEGDASKLTVTLTAESFFDLYQIAGTLAYDAESLELAGVSQGSFLGDPPEVIFFQRADDPGQIPFALTRRSISPGATGRGILLRAQFRVLTNRLPAQLVWLEEELVVRDSLRHDIRVSRPGGEER